MSCYHPLYKFKAGYDQEGKPILHWVRSSNYEVKDLVRLFGEDLVPIPCGKCIGCQLDYSKQWATRCILEASQYERNCFVTLTYDDAHLPKDGHVHKSVFSSFMKRLRRKYPDTMIRFFACGEYGSDDNTSRPHYHAILFNFDFDDKIPISKTLCRSKALEEVWTYGISSVGACSFASCGYVARYCMKKRSGESKFKDEFVLMSRMPGIGKNYYLDKKQLLFLSDYVYGDFGNGKFKAPIPRFFKKCAEKDGVDLSDHTSRKIKAANYRTKLDLGLYGFSHYEQLNKFSLALFLKKSEFLRRYI